jgi:isopentenyl diphosphate isomerase/L-lactate dehydrogenase-like FMN-dependent dehydrogenase
MTLVNVEDARRRARQRLPRMLFDYIDGGAFGETTLNANRADFDDLLLRQNVLTGVHAPDLTARFLGKRQALPFMLGPVGFLGLYASQGEQKAARAAHAAGIPFCLSTFSIASLADVRAATSGPLHFQLYVMKDRALADEMIAAARAAGAGALTVTVDCAVTSVRERDLHNGFRIRKRLTPAMLLAFATRPRWIADMALRGGKTVRAIAHRPEFGRAILEQAVNLSQGIEPALNWDDIVWIRARWNGALVVKGVLEAADALRAKDAGADAVVVSNHGGRQLDGASSTIRALPAIRAAVGDDFCLMLDGGIRRGSDVVKALACGADGVLLGRAYAFALAAAGERGVADIIEAIRTEIRVTLALMGVPSIAELRQHGAALVYPRECGRRAAI